MNVYRIRNWSVNFEHNKSRSVESCRYVCMPNKQDGLGLTRILALVDGTTVFGVWCLLLQACSRQRKRDGWLTDDGTENGRPWDLDDLSLRWRRPVSEIQRALDVVCDHKIGWMERLQSKCPLGAADCPPSVLECLEGIEEREGTPSAADATLDADDLFVARSKTSTAPTAPTDEQIADKLRAFVDWHSNDPVRAKANVVELAQLVAKFGAKPVNDAAHAVSTRTGKKAKLWELLPEILGTKPGSSTNPRQDIATKVVAAHGWEACSDAAGIPREAIKRKEAMIQAMIAEGPIFDAVVGKLAPELACPVH